MIAHRPAVEGLEARALLSIAGGPDLTYVPVNSTGLPEGFATVVFQQPIETQITVITGSVLQPDGKLVVVGYAQSDVNGNTSAGSTIDLARLNTDGSLDTTFGTNGVVTLAALPGEDFGKAVALQPDGKILVAATIAPSVSPGASKIGLYRLNADGSTDVTFGTAGVSYYNFQVDGHTDTGSAATTLALQGDGKIVVGGGQIKGSVLGFVRFNADGSDDTNFGTAGQALIPFTAANSALSYFQGVTSLLVQPGGQINYDATALNVSGTNSIVVGQLNADGSVDTTFGTAGQDILASTPLTGASNIETSGPLALQADGKLIVTGSFSSVNDAITTSTTHLDIFRLNADGTIDTDFGTMGQATPDVVNDMVYGEASSATDDQATSVLVQADGKILVGGVEEKALSGHGPTTVVRLNADGSPDLLFGESGQTRPFYEPYTNLPIVDSVYGLAIQADGKILETTEVGVARLLGQGSSNDFDDDGKTDVAVLLTNFAAPIFAYRPSSGTAGSPDSLTAFGISGAGQTIPAPGAYNGFGIDELAVYLPSLGDFAIGTYYLTGSSAQFISLVSPAEGASAIPAQADYSGSGQTEVAVYEPDTASFVYQYVDTKGFLQKATVPFGTPGTGHSIPAPADYDGVGHDEIAVYLPALGAFAYRPANGGADVIIPFGSAGIGNSIPVPADYDGSGHTELGVYLPALGAFAYRPYGGGADVIIPFGMPGAGNSIPMPGDYDGSGHTELAVYMPSIRAFAYRPYNGGADVIEVFGSPGVGNTIPFTPTGVEAFFNGGGGGGGGNGPTARPSANGLNGYVDFVPDLAGQARKKDAGATMTDSSQGRP